MAEFIAMEEMGRDTGYWWSPDERYLAFTQVDESPVELAKRYQIFENSFKVTEDVTPLPERTTCASSCSSGVGHWQAGMGGLGRRRGYLPCTGGLGARLLGHRVPAPVTGSKTAGPDGCGSDPMEKAAQC